MSKIVAVAFGVLVLGVLFFWSTQPDYQRDALEIGYTQTGAIQYQKACQKAISADQPVPVPDVYWYAQKHREVIDEARGDSDLAIVEREAWQRDDEAGRQAEADARAAAQWKSDQRYLATESAKQSRQMKQQLHSSDSVNTVGP